MPKVPGADLRRRLPSVDEVLLRPEVEDLLARHPRRLVLRHLRALLEEARAGAASGDEDALVHHAAFDSASARTLRDLFDLVGERPGTKVDVDGKPTPYGHELWLPLFWIFVGAEAPAY